MQTKEQQRSQFALDMVNQHFPQGSVDKKSANFIVGVPTMILTNGLAQTLAFLLSKKSKDNNPNKHDKAFWIVRDWLKKEKLVENSQNDLEFLKKISTLTQKEYFRAQQESLAMLHWLKRYARAFEV